MRNANSNIENIGPPQPSLFQERRATLLAERQQRRNADLERFNNRVDDLLYGRHEDEKAQKSGGPMCKT
jgi:hypothetical protein